ncbi:MAG: SpvB/TcaC N-terminal domain-containing protein, partial [Sediminibacterium sp.]
FPFSPSRNGFMPGMALSYNSGSGNGTFGLGWNAEPASITRKTERKLPEYNDAEESDVFIFSGAEDLVPALVEITPGHWAKDPQLPDNVTRYRPRTEGGFARIEKIKEASGNMYWKVTSKDNVISVFGKSKSAQVFNPADQTKIFQWLLEFSCDDKGNCFQYEYKKEDKLNVPNNLHEKNRRNEFSKCTNAYVKRIKYCNKNHFHRTEINYFEWESFLSSIEYLLELVLDYGEHDRDNPQPNDDLGWSSRQDPFSDYRAGFEIRTWRLCERVLMFHHFPELGEQSCLVRSVNFAYKKTTAFTFLQSVTQTGYIRKDGTYTSKSLPPVEFTYEPLGWNTEIKSLHKESLENLPVGIDDQVYQWIDLYSEGISGIITEQANGWYYKSNLGDGYFDALKLVSPKPSLNGLSVGAVHFQDIEANGQKHLVSNDLNGYYEFTPEDEWLPFKNFSEIPNIDLHDPNVKMLDLNGDGKADILISEENIFVWYASKGKEGFENYRTARKTFDEEKGPDIVFADSTQSIILADMSGDGLMDIVRIRNRDIVYWPNLGYGKFGAKVTMSNAPHFDHPDAFNSSYVKLADLDGSGIPDIVYFGKDSFKIYFNQSGNSWSEANIVNGVNPLPFPKMDDHANVTIVDLLGNGTGCIVWSSPLPKHSGNPLRYIDLMGGKKPHIMTSYKNNMGKETFIEYKPSTFFYLKDKQEGTPWVTKLPFPVQVVTKVITTDKWRQTRFTNQYTYHHGYYDFGEREFRGFGRVDQADIETFGEFLQGNKESPYISGDFTLYQPPVLTKTWFHTGAFINKEKVLSQFREEYFIPASEVFHENTLPEPDLEAGNLTIEEWKEALRSCKGMSLRQEIFELDADQLEVQNIVPVKLFSTACSNCHIKLLQPKSENPHAVFLTTGSETITYNYELNLRQEEIIIDPRIAHTLNLQTDEFGNVIEAMAVVYPRIGRHADDSLPEGAEELIAAMQKQQHISYSVNAFTNDVITNTDYRLRLPCGAKTFELTGLSPAYGSYFSLEELRSVTSGDINEIPYHNLPTNASLQKRMVQSVQMKYFKPDLKTPEDFGVLNHLALPYETYTLALTRDLLNAVLGEKLPALREAGESYYAMLDRVLSKGGYHKENDTWWIRSGIAGFATDAADHFYLPEKYTDPFDNVTALQFDEYDLYIKASDDQLSNHTEVLQFDFRVLAPSQMQDINNNISEVLFDIIGMPAAMALKGKGSEADNLDNVTAQIEEAALIDFFTAIVYHEAQGQSFLGNATARYVYYLGEVTTGETITYGNHPACAAGITREKHVAQLGDGEISPVQVAFEYSDGSGTVIAIKVPAEPETDGGAIRWITNGKTILNNKGKPVKQYEPYFTAVHTYEEPEQVGVTPVMYYDAADRVIRTEAPDGSYSRVEFTPWFSAAYDQNDTVLEEGNGWYRYNTNSTDPAIPMATDAQK